LPSELATGTYRFPGGGYDGEMYRIVAHDPFLARGYARYVDGPAQRYHRILVPALAYWLAFGKQSWIDISYIAVIAGFVFLGAYWLSRWAVLADVPARWALAFLSIPAALISAERMTVDVALAALTIGFAIYWKAGSRWKLIAVLAAACLARETGLLLVAGACLFELLQRRVARGLLWSAAALPMLAWYLVLRKRFPTKLALGEGTGIFHFLLHPPHYPLSHSLETVARMGDVLALSAVLLAAVLALWMLRAWPQDPLAVAAGLFVALILALPLVWPDPNAWKDVNAYGRFLSPLLILIALPSISGAGWLGLLPIALIDVRLGMQFPAEVGGIVRGLL
jgi:hypothetical protein